MTTPLDRLQAHLLEILTEFGPDGASVAELQFRFGADGPARTATRSLLKTLTRSGHVVRLDRDLYARAPEQLARDAAAVAAAESGGDEPTPAPESPRALRERALRYVDRRETNVRTMLDQVAAGLKVDAPFSAEATAEASRARAPRRADESGDDLTHLALVTIDGADAKDFDDAVYAEPRDDGGFDLWVAIADVSSYVEAGGALDAEARQRGCSVYFPGRVYPMLPFHLSDDVCSLRPNELRRCAWVRVALDARGAVTGRAFGFGVMRSRARLTYEQVQGVLDGGSTDLAPALCDGLGALDRVRELLFLRRRERGMLDLDLPEPRVALSADGLSVDQIEPSTRLDAHRLIEECMLAANEAVATWLVERGWPAVFRVHGEPNDERLAALRPILRVVAPDVALPESPRPADLERAIESAAGTPVSRLVSWLVLRTLPRAQYDVQPSLHFGLGTDRYLHFTSPIRRYPDLEVHRVLREALRSAAGPSDVRRAQLVDRLQASTVASNAGELLQTTAERQSDRMLRALFMRDHVGETFDALISDVAPFGLFVVVEHPFVEGLVPIDSLGDDFFELDPRQTSLVGVRTRRRYRIGGAIEITCVSADVAEGKVTFSIRGVEPRRVRPGRAKAAAARSTKPPRLPAKKKAGATRASQSKRRKRK
ncbi:MAG: VacB/RNase II family 3'-5' exoribonuclease [Myxococcales bacterium]|nr:VacB/RNase II family 3'-5' exoribonuclease [Myxococcales bacterium]MCB9532718.1 VacB/RNase II family 3'-5' exoribonuclease [Myxococcales bacterium]